MNCLKCGKNLRQCKIGMCIDCSKSSKRYAAYNAMKTRCYNEKQNQYKDYGGRGIIVCKEWLDSFIQFYIDIGPKPGDSYSLDRKDNDGNYCKNNCRWATKSEQNSNSRIRSNTGMKYISHIQKRSLPFVVTYKGKYTGNFSTLDEAIIFRDKIIK